MIYMLAPDSDGDEETKEQKKLENEEIFFHIISRIVLQLFFCTHALGIHDAQLEHITINN